MGIAVTDRITRGASGTSPFSPFWEVDAKISYITVSDLTERNAIPIWKRLPYMTVFVISESKEYQLGTDLTLAGQVWTLKTYGLPTDVITDGDIFDGNGFIQPQLIQNIFLNTSYVVADEASMLALTSLTGNFFIRTDTSEVYIKLNDTNPALITDFATSGNPGVVLSVNGQVGVVDITIATLLVSGTNLTDFNTAVEANSLVLGHSASIATNTSDISALDLSVSNLDAYIQDHLGTQSLTSLVTSPGVDEVGKFLQWDGTNYTLNSFDFTTGSGLTFNVDHYDLGGIVNQDISLSMSDFSDPFVFNLDVQTINLTGRSNINLITDNFVQIGGASAAVYAGDYSASMSDSLAIPSTGWVLDQIAGTESFWRTDIDSQVSDTISIYPDTTNVYSLALGNASKFYNINTSAFHSTKLVTDNGTTKSRIDIQPTTLEILINNSAGTSGQVLTSDGTYVSWQDITNSSLINGNGLTFDTDHYNLGGNLVTSTEVLLPYTFGTTPDVEFLLGTYSTLDLNLNASLAFTAVNNGIGGAGIAYDLSSSDNSNIAGVRGDTASVRMYSNDGSESVEFIITSNTFLAVFSDNKTSKTGIEYSATGYVTQLHSLTDKEYVDLHLLVSSNVASLGSASVAGKMKYCTNESGGAVPVFSDGTNWRRVTDRAIAS